MIEPTQTRMHKAGRCTALLPTVVLALAAALALSGNAMAATGVPCAPTGLETISTDQESYPPGETVYISGGGYAVACDVEIRITRPDAVVETTTVTTDLGGNLSHEYVLPPFPGVLGMYTLDAVGLGGAVLASHSFTDGPEIRSPDLVPGYVTTGGARSYFVLVRNTGDTVHRCIRVTLPAGYTAISVPGSAASQGSFSSSISGQVITFTNSTGIAAATSSGTVINGWGRFDIQATPPNNGPSGSDWTFRAWGNTACTSNQTSTENVRIVAGTQPADRRYRAEFVDEDGDPVTPAFGPSTTATFRLKMTKLADSQSNKISYFSVGVPRCFTGIAVTDSGTNSSNGFAWSAQVLDNFLRWRDPTSGELDDGHSVTVTFTANTASCVGNQVFPSTGWEDDTGSAGNASKLFTTADSPTMTINMPPAVAFVAPPTTADEGQTKTYNFTITDPDAGQTFTFVSGFPTCGTGGTLVGSPSIDSTAKTGSFQCLFPEGPSSPTVEVRVKDSANAESNTASQSVTVANVAPSAGFETNTPVAEGSDIELALTGAFDPSSADTGAGFEYAFDCGSGYGAFGNSNEASCATSDNGTRTAKGKIRDKDGGVSEYTASVTINNVAPSATFNAPASVNEGSNISLSLSDVVDPGSADTHEYHFSCDGGTTWTAWGNSNTHACPTDDNGTKTVKGQVRDDDGGTSAEYSATVAVDNVAPSATLNAPASVNEGSDIDLSLTDPSDPSSADTGAGFEYAFDCGSGYGAFGSSNEASCATSDNGTRTAKGKIRDKDGGVSEYTASVTINNVAPSATFNAPASVNEGSNIDISLSNVVDPGSADTHEYRFKCGDGDWAGWGASASASCPTTDNGTITVSGQVRDDDGGLSEVYSADVTVNNVAPSATFNDDGPVDEGSNIHLSLTDPSDPSSADTGAGFEYAFDCGSGYGAFGSSNAASCATSDNGTRTAKGKIRDKDGGVSEYTASVTINNVAPSATFNAPASVNEGSNIELSLTDPSDPSSVDTAAGFQYAFDCGSGYGAFGNSNAASCATSDNGTRTVKGKIRDKDGGVTEYTATVNVNNVSPTLTSLTPSSYLVLKGTSVSATGTYTDPGTGDTFTCIVNWDEPTGTPENVAGGSESCSAAHTYTAQGTYTVSMKVRDDDGGESNTLKIIITVYDPSAGGFVTGGGWIMSPTGSYAADPDASGRANFGFNSQYKKGASVPTGETEFQLHFASFNFHSDTYEVLVVSGYKAQYRGTGKVNGVGGHKFVLTAYDGQITGGGGVDRFRIKITRLADDVVVYDTRMAASEDMDDANPLELGGGSIVIHKAK